MLLFHGVAPNQSHFFIYFFGRKISLWPGTEASDQQRRAAETLRPLAEHSRKVLGNFRRRRAGVDAGGVFRVAGAMVCEADFFFFFFFFFFLKLSIIVI
jgi:hypothetical protein